MCGITGIYNLNNHEADSLLIEKMTAVLNHRGPDDSGIFSEGNVALGHCRLSIIDLSKAGHQPMSDRDGAIWITYNGEIYNFQEVRNILIGLGYNFKSKSDTEVILYSYQEWGEDCLKRFNGMFAFAIWDKKNQKLFLARDRLGKKPLYYYLDNEKFVFASEIKAILEDESIKRDIDIQGMANYFTFGHSIAPDTIYQGIKKLLPGHCLILKNGKIEIKQYWNVSLNDIKEDKGENYYKEKIIETFKDSVKQRLISDVPLGVFLSGGIDSSSVVAMMAECGVAPIKTFSVGFNIAGNEFNELADAKLVADYFKTEHHEVVLKELDLINTLNKLVYHFDEPFGDAASFPVFYISQFAKKQVKVVLTGEGADEIFGGYRRYAIEKNRAKFLLFCFFIKNNLIQKFIGYAPKFRRVKKFLETLPISNDLFRYTNWLTCFSEEMQERLFKKEFFKEKTDSLKIYEEYFSQKKTKDILKKVMYLDQKILLPDYYLEKVDKASMAVGLEVRAPFLDYRLVELADSIPSDYKIKGFETKYIFKKAMENFLPEKILNKKKHGFAVPTNLWFRGALRDYLSEVIFDKTTKSRGYFNFDYIEKLFNLYQNKNQPLDYQFWLILNFELWHRQFIDKK